MKRDVAALQTLLRNAGLRATSARIAVLAELLAAKTPQTHADIAERLASTGADRATVYRNLIDLTEVGLARRTDLGDHVWRFEAVSARGAEHEQAHPHFVCTSCGTVACLPETSVSLAPGRGAPKALRLQHVSVQLRGLCDACA